MTVPLPPLSPRTTARIGGALYLFIIVAALFGEAYVRGTLIVSGDAAATARRILGSETLFRLGLAGEMLTCVFDVALALIFYVLLKPVSRNLALLAALLRLTYVGIYGVAKLFEIAALAALHGPDSLKDVDPAQWDDLAFLLLRVHGLGYGASLLFFGCSCVLMGYLMFRSQYLPRTFGVLLVIAGASYALYSLAQMLAPQFADQTLFPWMLLPGLPAEWGLCLWLLIKGIDLPKWNEHGTNGPNASA